MAAMNGTTADRTPRIRKTTKTKTIIQAIIAEEIVGTTAIAKRTDVPSQTSFLRIEPAIVIVADPAAVAAPAFLMSTITWMNKKQKTKRKYPVQRFSLPYLQKKVPRSTLLT